MDREDVRAVYRSLLGREPENEAILDQHASTHSDLASFLTATLNSPEFTSKDKGYATVVSNILYQASYPVEVDVSEQQQGAIFKRVAAQWKALGETDPYWSVLSGDEFRASAIEANLEKFKETGRHDATLIELFARRNGVDLRRDGTCLELGCGVGRVTRFLAEKFGSVLALDISPGNLQIAERYLSERNARNVAFRLIEGLDDLEKIGGFDFFFSMIVLQHNPPPMIKRILACVLRQLNPGGAFLFQVPTHMLGYAFDAQTYVASEDPKGKGFEIHGLPMHVVLELLDASNCRVVEVLPDTFVGGAGSTTFFGMKKARS